MVMSGSNSIVLEMNPRDQLLRIGGHSGGLHPPQQNGMPQSPQVTSSQGPGVPPASSAIQNPTQNNSQPTASESRAQYAGPPLQPPSLAIAQSLSTGLPGNRAAASSMLQDPGIRGDTSQAVTLPLVNGHSSGWYFDKLVDLLD